MSLAAIPRHCFSNRYLLRHGGQAIGEMRGYLLDESVEVATLGQQQYRFQPAGVMTRRFQLIDMSSGAVVGATEPSEIFKGGWRMELTYGSADLRRPDLFAPTYHLIESEQQLALAEPLHVCVRAWRVRDFTAGMPLTDMLLIGLTYHLIRRRARKLGGAGGG